MALVNNVMDEQEDYWIIPDDVDTAQFDLGWLPDPFDPPYIHQFGTQHQKTGGPRYVALGATQIKYQNCQHAIHKLSTENWVIPPYLDTRTFDFSWHPDDTEEPMIHVFGTQHSHTGGPRYVVPGATKKKYYPQEQRLRARALPHMTHWTVPPNTDVSQFDFSWHPHDDEPPYIYQFGTQHQKTGGPRYTVPGARRIKYMNNQAARSMPDKSHWVTLSTAVINDFDWSWHPDSTDELTNYVFGDRRYNSVAYVHTSYPQYKYIDTPSVSATYKPLELVYLSNGEPHEEDRYQQLCTASGRKVIWVRGINGREQAIKHAAQLCSGEYFMLFPGKLWADSQFNYDFQPSQWPDHKHYIFYARNPVNGLEYGHQAAVCYNRQLVLSTDSWGLDFTMSKPHTVIPQVCGDAQYNVSPQITWRTAFREVLKLKAESSTESLGRLAVWQTVASGPNSQWSLRGAHDGIEYYVEVAGNHSELMRSFDWSWLEQKFATLYPDQNK